jgi:hypothetical protein
MNTKLHLYRMNMTYNTSLMQPAKLRKINTTCFILSASKVSGTYTL